MYDENDPDIKVLNHCSNQKTKDSPHISDQGFTINAEKDNQMIVLNLLIRGFERI